MTTNTTPTTTTTSSSYSSSVGDGILPVPCFDSFASVYENDDDDDDVATEKYSKLDTIFQETYKGTKKPDFYVRAPGRVNLIGEHIDYEGYSVLPMAIGREVILCVSLSSTNNNKISLTNVNSSQFTSRTIPIDPHIDIKTNPLHWSHYFQCGYKGAWLLTCPGDDNDNNNNNNTQNPSPRQQQGIGMNILVQGDIPLASGLSSSSALVVASTIATMKAISLQEAEKQQQLGPPTIRLSRPEQLADICRQAEGYIGTMGGGMDQAISIMGEKGIARVIHFDGSGKVQNTEPVKLPSKVVIVIADSLTKAEKAKDAKLYYNKRVVECTIASKQLAKILGITNWKQMTTLKQVHDNQLLLLEEEQHTTTLDEMANLAQQHLMDIATPKLLCEFFDVTNLIEIFPNDDPKINLIRDVVEHHTEYKLRSRAIHVYSEASRVYKFQQICSIDAAAAAAAVKKDDDNNDDNDDDSVVKMLGELMNQSQISCRDLYECSSVELDLLTDACRKLGAVGSRLTGAGWGGSTVSLVYENQVNDFIRNLKVEYYNQQSNNNDDSNKDDDENNREVVFACKPMTGACIFHKDSK